MRWHGWFTLEQTDTDAAGEHTGRITCGSGLLIMHLFAKQINRRITQTNISHRTASVNRPIPEEKKKRGGGGESLFILTATACTIHTAETHNSPMKMLTSAPPPPLPPPTDTVQGSRGSYEQLLDVMVPTVDSCTASLRESALEPAA